MMSMSTLCGHVSSVQVANDWMKMHRIRNVYVVMNLHIILNAYFQAANVFRAILAFHTGLAQ